MVSRFKPINLGGVDLNTLPNKFAMYGAWGSHGCSNAPNTTAAFSLITFTGESAGINYQTQIAFIGTTLYLRVKNYQNQWSNWRGI